MPRRKPTGKDDRKLGTGQKLTGIARVAAITYKASPLAVFIKLAGTIITSVLPIVTTYFAALTTTALARAYTGDHQAGADAIMYVVITAALGVALTAWTSIEQYINQFVRYRIDAAISDRLYEQFLALDFWRYDDKKTADLFDKSKQFANFFTFVFDKLSSIVTALVSLISGLIALLLVSWWLGVILLAAVIPGIIIQFRLSRARVRHWNENVETRRAKDMIEWNMFQVSAIAELRLYGMVRHLLNLRMKLRDKDEKVRIEFERKFIGLQLGADILEAVAEVVALIYTTMQIIAHALPVGQFLYVQQIVSRALTGVSSFISQLSSIDSDIANLFDYNEFMQLPRAMAAPKRLKKLPNMVRFDHVWFHYPGNKTNVLKDISLEVHQGQHVAIVGENGAGKSTLVKLLLGLYKPTKGTVYLDDINLADVSTEDWHRHLGVLEQTSNRYSFATARDNILLGDVSHPVSHERFETALDAAEARTFLEKLPKGLDNYVNQWIEHDDGTPGVDLSGGQWQRLALARNFYRDSPIIILDEPTSAIDALAESRIFKRLLKNKHKTIITISHRVTTIEKADIIYMLENGEIVEQGTHAELVAKKGSYYRMFESQLL
ncbi:MAG TPA: ABC transporter ATP-binding protein [Dongiaceae bacterium]|nr:ABC transporter ATP-binding protein [Dongiaceae bacterium]